MAECKGRQCCIGVGVLIFLLLAAAIVAPVLVYVLRPGCDDSSSDKTDDTNTNLPLGSTCEMNKGKKCADANAKCTTDEFGASKCTCKGRLFDDNGSTTGGTCIEPNVDLGAGCANSDECKDLYSQCVIIGNSSTATCTCRQGATANANGKCEYRPKLGEECDPNGPFKCMDENAECDSSTYRCQCVEKYFDNDDNKNNVGGVCLSDKTDDGEYCKITDERYAFCYHGCCNEDDNIKCCKDPLRKPLYVGLVIAAGALLVVIIVILTVCLCCQRCKRNGIKEKHESSELNSRY